MGLSEKIAELSRMKDNTKGAMRTGAIQVAILALVLLTVLFELYASLVPTAQAAGNSLNATGVPLGSLFTGGGVVFVIIMAALIIIVVQSFMPGGKK